MSHAGKVARNSMWLAIQPLALNLVSLFVIGYIARSLGQHNYGIFVFAFGLVAMFTPLTNIGLSSITTREITENRDNASIILGKVLALRFLLSLCACIIMAITVNVLGYSGLNRMVIYIAGSTLVFNALSTTFHSAFQGIEQMEYIAYAQFISGATLILLSVTVLHLGYNVIALSVVYSFGSFVGLAMIAYFFVKNNIFPKITVDTVFWKTNLRRGLPFFVPAMVALMGNKAGLIMLSKMAGESSVGIYGAAFTLIDRLSVIPDSIVTAIFPTLAFLYQRSREEAVELFKKYFLYLLLIGLPIAVGTTILGDRIVLLIYGEKYAAAIPVLRVMIWWTFLVFISAILSWTLSAIHRERKAMIVPFVSTGLYLLMNVFLIPSLKALGLGITDVAANLISFLILYFFTAKYFVRDIIEFSVIRKVVLANSVMALAVVFFRDIGVLIAIPAGAVVYGIAVLKLNIVPLSDVKKISEVFIKRKGAVSVLE